MKSGLTHDQHKGTASEALCPLIPILPALLRVRPERAYFRRYRAARCLLQPVQLSPDVFLEICNLGKTQDEAGNLTAATFEHSLPLEEC